MGTGNTAPAPAPAPAPAIDVADSVNKSVASLNESIKTQQELMAISMQANTAMAYLQMALSVSGKVAGR